MGFPAERPRRLLSTPAIRSLFAGSSIAASSLIAPLFVQELSSDSIPVPAMPGQLQESLDSLIRHVTVLVNLGIRSILLFGIPATKSNDGHEAWDDDGVVQRSLRQLRLEFGDTIVLLADCCLCEYTDHGHCGVLSHGKDGSRPYSHVDNDRTALLYGQVALSQAAAGADMVAPSGMMDGQVGAIRQALDAASYTDTGILAYSAKYASSLYGPFRDAAGSAPATGDRKGHQLPPGALHSALRKVRLDLEEGADATMVKPALWNGDVIAAVAASTDVPVVAYSVSGEYAMVKFAAQAGAIDERGVVLEGLASLQRAGASAVITYHAEQVGHWLS